MNKQTKTERFLSALQSGEELTEGQVRSRFGLANVSATVSHLRQHGYAIYGNRKLNSRGEQVTRYRLGSPTRSVVAAGFRALAAA